MIDWCEKKQIKAKIELAIELAPTHTEFPVGREETFSSVHFLLNFLLHEELQTVNSKLHRPTITTASQI